MDILILIGEGLRVLVGFLNLLFIPGFVISLALFPRFTDMGLIQRLAYSTVLSISSVISLVLFMDVVLGVDTTPQNISFGIGVFSASLLVIWLCEIWYLSSSLPAKVHRKFSGGYQVFQRYFSRMINSRRDRFTKTAMTTVVWHESVTSDRNHIEHTYLIDAGEEIDIQQVDEAKWKISDNAMVPPPYPRTRYFELAIREYKEAGLSLIDDLQVFPVTVTRKPDSTRGENKKKRGTLKISGRICEKTETAEIQWIYSHDFHIFAIIHSEDTLGQMVDRVITKIDEIASSIKSGSRVSSHVEDTQMLKDAFDVVLERPRRIPTGTAATTRRPEPRIPAHPTESDRRKLQADIVRDLKVHHVTPETFRSSDSMITKIKIPKKADVDKVLASIKEIQDDDWLYE
jgi:hypothetical protein